MAVKEHHRIRINEFAIESEEKQEKQKLPSFIPFMGATIIMGSPDSGCVFFSYYLKSGCVFPHQMIQPIKKKFLTVLLRCLGFI